MLLSGEIHHQLANSKADYLVTVPLLVSKVQEAIGQLHIQVDPQHKMIFLLLLDHSCPENENLPLDYSFAIMIPGSGGRRG